MVSMRITSLVVLTVLFYLLLLLLNSLAVHLTVETDALDGELVVAAYTSGLSRSEEFCMAMSTSRPSA
jgi:hypothetical protein